MNLKELIFGKGASSGGEGGVYRDSIQAWLPIKNIIGGVVITKDNRFVKILELLPVNVYLKSANDRQNIVSSFAAYLKIAPNDLQMVARTLPADTQAYVEQMRRFAEQEENEDCREMIEDNIQEIGYGIASDAMRHRFFLVFQYEANMRAKHNTAKAILQRLNEEADTARRYLDACELEVLEPRYSDNFVLKLLYEILNKQTGQRVRLPDGILTPVGWRTGGAGAEGVGSFFFEVRSENESEGTDFRQGGKLRRRGRCVPRQHSSLATHQKHHRRCRYHEGQPLCEDPRAAAGQRLFEVSQ